MGNVGDYDRGRIGFLRRHRADVVAVLDEVLARCAGPVVDVLAVIREVTARVVSELCPGRAAEGLPDLPPRGGGNLPPGTPVWLMTRAARTEATRQREHRGP